MLKRFRFISMVLLLVCAYFSLNSCRCDTNKIMNKAGSWELPVLINHGKVEIPGVTIRMPDYIEKTNSKLVLLEFDSIYGGPIMLSSYQDLYEKYQDQGLVVISIFLDKSEEVIKKEITTYIKNSEDESGKIAYPVCWDLKQEVKTLYGITMMPTTFLINKDNKIVYEQSGWSKELVNELEQKIKEFLNQ